MNWNKLFGVSALIVAILYFAFAIPAGFAGYHGLEKFYIWPVAYAVIGLFLCLGLPLHREVKKLRAAVAEAAAILRAREGRMGTIEWLAAVDSWLSRNGKA